MNKAILMGRLTKDPELRYTQNETPVCTFTLAVEKYVKDEKQADFIPIVAWNKLAEVCSKFLSKRSKIVIVGRIQTRSWEDDDGNKHFVTEVVAEEMYFADSKKENTEANSSDTNDAKNKDTNTAKDTAEKQSKTTQAPPPWLRR